MSINQPRNAREVNSCIGLGLLTRIGEIQGVSIPDVTIEGTDFRSAAKHLADEAKEVREELERVEGSDAKLTAYLNDLAILQEVIDVVIMGLSTVNAFTKKYNKVEVMDAVAVVLAKNAERRYYDVVDPLHVDDMLSGSAQRARQETE